MVADTEPNSGDDFIFISLCVISKVIFNGYGFLKKEYIFYLETSHYDVKQTAVFEKFIQWDIMQMERESENEIVKF